MVRARLHAALALVKSAEACVGGPPRNHSGRQCVPFRQGRAATSGRGRAVGRVQCRNGPPLRHHERGQGAGPGRLTVIPIVRA